MFSSANEMSMKQTARGEFLQLGFVTPSLDELRVAHEVLLGSDTTTETKSESQWDSFGGKLRWAFNKTEKEVEMAMNNAVGKFDIDKIGAIINGQVDFTIGQEGGVPTSLFSTFLDPNLETELSKCSLLPKSVENDSKRMDALIRLYCAENLIWVLSSDKIFNKIVEKYDTNLSLVLEKLGKATVKTRFGGLAGHSFESKAPKTLAAGGTFPMRELVLPQSGINNEEEYLKLGEKELVPLSDVEAKNIETVLKNCTSPEVFYNICGKFKDVDAIAPPEMSFQYTSSGSHSADLETTARMNKFALDTDSTKPLIQAFVVPTEMFDVWRLKQQYQFHKTTVVLKLNEKRVWEGCFEGTVLLPNADHEQMNAASGLKVEVDDKNRVLVSREDKVCRVPKNKVDKAMKDNQPVPCTLDNLTYSMTSSRTVKMSSHHDALCEAQQTRLRGVRQVVIGLPFSKWEKPSDALKRMDLSSGQIRNMVTLARADYVWGKLVFGSSSWWDLETSVLMLIRVSSGLVGISMNIRDCMVTSFVL
jgi:hypothetical protein